MPANMPKTPTRTATRLNVPQSQRSSSRAAKAYSSCRFIPSREAMNATQNARMAMLCGGDENKDATVKETARNLNAQFADVFEQSLARSVLQVGRKLSVADILSQVAWARRAHTELHN